MSLVQEFQAEITWTIQDNLEEWLEDPDNMVEAMVDTIMSVADDLNVFRGLL